MLNEKITINTSMGRCISHPTPAGYSVVGTIGLLALLLHKSGYYVGYAGGVTSSVDQRYAKSEVYRLRTDAVRELADAILSGKLEEALKLAESIGSRDEIGDIAGANDITVPGEHHRSWGRVTFPAEPRPQDPVLHRLDILCEDHFLSVLNTLLTAASEKTCDRDSYGEPVKWECGISVEDLDSLARACAETFIEN